MQDLDAFHVKSMRNFLTPGYYTLGPECRGVVLLLFFRHSAKVLNTQEKCLATSP